VARENGSDLAALGAADRWADQTVHLKVDRQKVENSPLYDPSITIDGAYEERFLSYYGVKWIAA
jgi:hypothetical protein